MFNIHFYDFSFPRDSVVKSGLCICYPMENISPKHWLYLYVCVRVGFRRNWSFYAKRYDDFNRKDIICGHKHQIKLTKFNTNEFHETYTHSNAHIHTYTILLYVSYVCRLHPCNWSNQFSDQLRIHQFLGSGCQYYYVKYSKIPRSIECELSRSINQCKLFD